MHCMEADERVRAAILQLANHPQSAQVDAIWERLGSRSSRHHAEWAPKGVRL